MPEASAAFDGCDDVDGAQGEDSLDWTGDDA